MAKAKKNDDLDVLRNLCNAFTDDNVSEEDFLKQVHSFFGTKPKKTRVKKVKGPAKEKRWDDYKPFTKARRGLGSY